MSKKKPTREWSAQRDCLSTGLPVIAMSISGVSQVLTSSGEVWMAFPCLERGSITDLVGRLRALADQIELMQGMEGGMWSMPWEKEE